MRKVPVIGLFSGAGGLEIGADWAGADVRVCAEIDPVACQTLRQNLTRHRRDILEGDVRKLNGRTLRRIAELSRRDPCLVIGGPPCQPFSKLAYWTDPGDDSRYRRARARGEKAERPDPITEAQPDERRSLVDDFWRLVLEIGAEGFLFENVPSITHPRNKAILDRLIEAAESAGYKTLLLRVNAVEYGVPQSRHRIVLLGLRGGTPTVPETTHSAIMGHSLKPAPVTAGEALAPCAASRYFEPEEVVTGRWAEQLRQIPAGKNYKALTAWAGHTSPVFDAETRFWNFLLKLSPDLPSWTIAANPGPLQ